ncbi:MAG: asparagine synthase B [Bacillota bacterium]
MCGIIGYYGENASKKSLAIDSIGHRGPDGNGQVCGVNFKFGHTRLAILDVEGGVQPMTNEDTSMWITFNGEIYNHEDIRNSLKHDHHYRTTSDTEVILHLMEEEGWKGLKRLDGMFALAVASRDSFTVARDPLGIKPLYYMKAEDGLYFGSEIKSFQGKKGKIELFPPGHIYTSEKGFERYYELPTKYSEEMDWDETLEEIRNRLRFAVEKRLMADVPVGSFLSGGLDSSLVSALIKDMKEDDVHTFSVALENSSDRYYSQMASKYLGTIHHEYLLTPEEMWNTLPEVIYHLESFDRSLVRSAVANYFLAKIASEHVKVALSGEGADELFAGYEYLNQFGDRALQKELVEITSELHNTNLQRNDRMTMAHGLEGRVPFLDVDMISLGLRIPPKFKRDQETGAVKWCLREAFADQGILPDEIIHRGKEKFSEGTGVADILEAMAEEKISDRDFQQELAKGTPLKSKEEYYYYKLFESSFGSESYKDLVGRSRS